MRAFLYAFARFLGDLSAIFSGSPSRIARRGANRLIGRKLVRRLWL